MILTNKQEEGLRIALQNYRSGEPYTVIAGYAGTGKSTLVRFIIDALQIEPENVAYIAFTGKAAQVLRSKGCPGAMTAHRLLYKSVKQPDGSFIHIPKDSLPIAKHGVIIVDEVSMLPKPMWELLLSHHIHVIACGDPAQLPAIGETSDALDNPDIFLDEIMRQAQESEIIRLTMDIRAGKPIKPYRGQEINIVTHDEICDGMLHWADQVICAKNDTRRAYNELYRTMLWGEEVGPEPLIGDKVICLKNNWDKINPIGDALVNGTTGKITDLTVKNSRLFDGKSCWIDFHADYEDELNEEYSTFMDVHIDWKLITTGEPTINKENFRRFPRTLKFNEFDYGYVITCHKSQGSEWPKVLVIEEGFPFEREEHKRWLYTACTRAQEKLTLVLK